MKIMRVFVLFVANYAKGGVRGEVIGNQAGEVFPSFTVRL